MRQSTTVMDAARQASPTYRPARTRSRHTGSVLVNGRGSARRLPRRTRGRIASTGTPRMERRNLETSVLPRTRPRLVSNESGWEVVRLTVAQ